MAISMISYMFIERHNNYLHKIWLNPLTAGAAYIRVFIFY